MGYPQKHKNSDRSSRKTPLIVGSIVLMLAMSTVVFVMKSIKASQLSQTVYFVDQNAPNCELSDTVFCTISEAVDAAPPYATINIQAGVYHENIYLTQPVTLIGIGQVVIDPNEWESVRVYNADVTLKALTIAGNYIGLSLNGEQSTANLENVTIKTDSMVANQEAISIVIRGGDGHKLMMTDSRIVGAPIGIRINGGNQTVITGEKIILDAEDVDLMIFGGSQHHIQTGILDTNTLTVEQQGGYQHTIE